MTAGEAIVEADQLRERARGLSVIIDVSGRIASTLDLQEILQASVDGVTQLIGLDTAAVYLVEGDMLRLMATTPPLPPEFPEPFRVARLADHPHVGRALALHSAVLVQDFHQEASTPAEREIMEGRNLRTVLYVPLVAESEALGIFIVGSIGLPTEVSALHLDLSTALANLVALGVTNARLFADREAYAARLEQTLHDRIQAEAEQRRLQDELIQAQKMESVGRLAGGVAHDFNNMLSIILGYADLAREQGTPNAVIRQALDQIIAAGERSADLTRQLLAFARRQTAEPKVIDLNETIENILKMLRRLMGEHVALEWKPADDLGKVRIDPTQVDQIVANLCVNARDAMEGGGRIVLETGERLLDDERCAENPNLLPGRYLMVAVNDDGTGMTPEVRTKIFEPYFSTKEEGKGTGLGLSTVYGIVHQNNGCIDVESAPGEGTTITVYLPRYDAEAVEGSHGPTRTETAQGGETILLVEDEPMTLQLGQRMLEALGYAVFAASGPAEALRIARRHCTEIALLVTDVVMPQMNGRELSEQVAAICPGIRTLYVSGYTADVIADDGVLREGVTLLSKPFSLGELAARVRWALERDHEA